MTIRLDAARVLIVDDEPVIRSALRELIDDEADLEAAGEATNGEEAIDRVTELDPDVVLMDMRMPRLDGLGATRTIKERSPHVRIVLLTAYDDASLRRQAEEAGADAYVVKGALAAEVLEALRGGEPGVER